VLIWNDALKKFEFGPMSGGGGGGSAHIIQEEGVSLPARAKLNFIGGIITASDDGASNSTKVTIDTSGLATAAQGALADTALQSGDIPPGVIGVSYNPGSIIPTGALLGTITAKKSGTIIGYKLTSVVATDMVVDIWKANAAIPTDVNTITASAKPTLTEEQVSDSTTLTGWTTSFAEGDRFVFSVDSNTASTGFTLELITT
jgi:hypothetical protein